MMIITCNNCNKRFEIDSNLIPESGRLLQCSGCNHKWFYQKESNNKPATNIVINDTKHETEPVKIKEPTEETEPVKIKDPTEETEPVKIKEPMEIDITESIELLDKTTKKDYIAEKILIKDKNIDKDLNANSIENKKNYKILNLTIIFIISFIALIIILDTFQNPIRKFFPNIEFLLYNLYESFSDIILFFGDLI
jgi:predicted Zn finger-like uncharacterized protein